MANSTYNLYLQTSRGLIYIPCGKIEDIDNFTVRFENHLVFLSVLIEILKLDISLQDINEVYLSNRELSEQKEKGFDYERCLPIKYGFDNFKLDSLIGYFADFLKKDRKRLENYKPHVENIIPNYDKGTYYDSDIELFAKSYLTQRYRRQRDEYFYLKNLCDYQIMIGSMPSSRHEKHGIYEMDFSTRKRFLGLIELSYSNFSKYEEKLENFSLDDFSNLAKCIILLSPVEEDIKQLENLTGMPLEKIQLLCKGQLKCGRKRWTVY